MQKQHAPSQQKRRREEEEFEKACNEALDEFEAQEKGKEKEVIVYAPQSQDPFASGQASLLPSDEEDEGEDHVSESDDEKEKEKEPPKKKVKTFHQKSYRKKSDPPLLPFPKKRSVSFSLHAKTLFLTYPQCDLSPEEGKSLLVEITGEPLEYIVAQEDHQVTWKCLDTLFKQLLMYTVVNFGKISLIKLFSKIDNICSVEQFQSEPVGYQITASTSVSAWPSDIQLALHPFDYRVKIRNCLEQSVQINWPWPNSSN